jgi:hypothetical protein
MGEIMISVDFTADRAREISFDAYWMRVADEEHKPGIEMALNVRGCIMMDIQKQAGQGRHRRMSITAPACLNQCAQMAYLQCMKEFLIVRGFTATWSGDGVEVTW